MGRLTEVFDTIQNGFGEPEEYHWIEPRDEKTRGILKIMRKLAKRRKFGQKAVIEWVKP